jgi:hypothetical protein
MTHSEQEEILRRALHAVADTIEPAADGLERIRERLSRPRPLAVAWLMVGWTGLAQPLLLRMEPVLAGAAGRLSDWLAEWLRLMVRSLRAAAERLRPAAVRLHLWVERLRPVGGLLADAIRMLRPGSGMSRHEKLRAALAFGAAILIGAAGGLALSDGLQPVISTMGSVLGTNGSGNHASSPGHGSGLSNSSQPYPQTSSNAPGSVHRQKSTPRPACSATRAPSPSTSTPTPSPSTSTPTPSPSTSTPTPTPDQTSSATTPAPGSTPAQANASAGVSTGVPPLTAPNHSSRGVNADSVGTGPFATPSTGASPTPTSPAGTSVCG